MNTSFQTQPGALPPEAPYERPRLPRSEALDVPAAVSADVPHDLVVQALEPSVPECLTCGDREGPWYPDPRGRRYPSGAQIAFCGTCVPDASPTQAAAAVMSAEMDENEGSSTAQQLAQAEERAGILFDAAHVEAAVSAALEQARTEYAVELAERGKQLAAMAGANRQRDAVLRLCEGRRGDDLLLVSAVAAAAESGTTALDDLPMTVAWTGDVTLPDGGTREGRAVVRCVSSYGGRADLVIEGDDRMALASLLDAEVVLDINAPCPTDGCGTVGDYDAADPALFGWARVEVAGIEDSAARWYCSPMCVSNALARAGEELAVIDDMDAVDGGL